MVCGLGGVGLRAVERLHGAGVAVVVVDLDPDVRAEQAIAVLGIPLIRASSRTAAALQAAGLAGARAVVCTESNELHTLEVALLTRTLRPDVRVVAQFANPGVGEALESATGAIVIDVAALSAPSLVEACLDRTTHDIDLGGTRFRVTRQVVDGPAAPFRSRFGDLSPLAVARADGTGGRLPGPRPRADAGRRRDHRGPGRPGGPREPPVHDRGSRGTAVVRSVLRSDRALVLTVSGLLALVIVATVVLRYTYHSPRGGLSALDASISRSRRWPSSDSATSRSPTSRRGSRSSASP